LSSGKWKAVIAKSSDFTKTGHADNGGIGNADDSTDPHNPTAATLNYLFLENVKTTATMALA